MCKFDLYNTIINQFFYLKIILVRYIKLRFNIFTLQKSQLVFTPYTSGFTGKFYSFAHFNCVSFLITVKFSWFLIFFSSWRIQNILLVSFILLVAPSFIFCYFIRWRTMFGIAVIPSILLALGMAISPESPRWLYQVFLQLRLIICCRSIKFTCQLNHWKKQLIPLTTLQINYMFI